MSILVRVLLFWVLGILSAWACVPTWMIGPPLVILAWLGVALMCFIIIPRSVRVIPKISLHIILLFFLSSFQITMVRSGSSTLPIDESLQIYGTILEVWSSERFHRIKIRVSQFQTGGIVHECREVVLLQTGNQITEGSSIGNSIVAETRLQKIKKRKDFQDFPERLYYAGEGIRKKGWISKWDLADSSVYSGFNPLIFAGDLQQFLCNHLDSCSIEPEQASIIKAMLLGRKDDLPSEIKSVFQQTGISHLLAVSGLHVGLIYLVFIRIFFFMKRFQRAILLEFLAVMAVWAYSLMTGFGPSVQRAAGMISLFALSRMLGRRVEPMQVLIIAFIFQTAFDPFAIFRFGFQLSYLAVAGIFIVYGPWKRLLKSTKGLFRKIWNFAGVSIAAQTFTIPFVLIYFHQFPVYFILGNLLLVPLGLMVFYLGALYLLMLSVGISFSQLGQLLDLIIRLMVGMGDSIAKFPHSMITFDSFTLLDMLAYYVFIVIIIFIKPLSLYRKVLWVLCSVLVFSVLALFIDF